MAFARSAAHFRHLLVRSERQLRRPLSRGIDGIGIAWRWQVEFGQQRSLCFSRSCRAASAEQADGDVLEPEEAGRLFDPEKEDSFIPQYDASGLRRRRVLVLCTGGTMTMEPNAAQGGALAPVQGALTRWVARRLDELRQPDMPQTTVHEYSPLMDSSDMGPKDYARVARDIAANYNHFDGFVVVMGTDTMAYAASALAFMLENLGKPVIFTGSQIPLSEAYSDARRNLIMAIIFASRDTICEVAIFFHDRLLRGCRATKINTHRLMGFDSPNLLPLAQVGIGIDETDHLALRQARGALRVHRHMDTRLLVLRLVPGFDDTAFASALAAGQDSQLRALVLQLYGTGNFPSKKTMMIDAIASASQRGILVVATTQCPTGSVVLGKYAVGGALKASGVVSGGDMTLEATVAKLAYLFGRGDLATSHIGKLMDVPLRGEVTPAAEYNRSHSHMAGLGHSASVHARVTNGLTSLNI